MDIFMSVSDLVLPEVNKAICKHWSGFWSGIDFRRIAA